MQNLITISQAAERLGITRQWMHRLVRDNHIPVVKVADGKLFLLHPREVERLKKIRKM